MGTGDGSAAAHFASDGQGGDATAVTVLVAPADPLETQESLDTGVSGATGGAPGSAPGTTQPVSPA
jgi:hypothetical protein